MKAQAKTATKAATVSTKAARNTPVTKAAKAAPKAATVSTKVDTKAATETAPKAVFALVAGTIAQVVNKGLRQAIAYHVSKGNLDKVDAGIQLTAQGAMLWTKERVELDPSRFHEVAAFVHGGAIPKEWNGNHKPVDAMGTLKGAMLKLPNNLYWGSFASSDMRRAFAALWATKK